MINLIENLMNCEIIFYSLIALVVTAWLVVYGMMFYKLYASKRLLRMAKMHRCWFVAAVFAYLFIIYITVWSQ